MQLFPQIYNTYSLHHPMHMTGSYGIWKENPDVEVWYNYVKAQLITLIWGFKRISRIQPMCL